MEERRIRDPDTGEISYIKIEGSGLFDIFAKIGTKLTGKNSRKKNKAAEKLIEKGAEKVGERTGEVLGENNHQFIQKKTKGKEIA